MKKHYVFNILALIMLFTFCEAKSQKVYYIWSTGDTTAIISPSPTISTTYYVTVTQYGINYIDSFNLVVAQPANSLIIESICLGDTFTTASGNYATSSGIYSDTISSLIGCDSIITLQLTIDTLDLSLTNINDSLVSNDTNATTYQWINCDSNNAIIAGATNQGYRPTMSGNYAVIITEGACIDTTACENFIIKSIIGQTNATNFMIYPNPTTGNVYLELIREPEMGSIMQIYNLTGQLVKEVQIQNKKTLLDIRSLEKSVYFFNYGNTTKKIVLTN
mgnify:CR=1 FL=1